MADPADLVRRCQERLLAATRGYFLQGGRELSARVADAFLAVPRHLFIERYRHFGAPAWTEVDPDDLVEHLPVLYADEGLGIGGMGEAAGDKVATISRPAVVLFMLELLQVEPGDRVFEVGAGSGWNAGLLGHLAGSGGHVDSVEIRPELAGRAARAIERAGISNVSITCGDAGLAADGARTFDRVIFTAGAYDLPGWLHERVRVGGALLMVQKFPGGGDLLILFRRRDDHFESVSSRPVEFVHMLGAAHRAELDPVRLDEFPPWAALCERRVSRVPAWFGGRGRADLAARTAALRSWLALCEPRMRWFAEPEGWPLFFFGLWDEPTGSLAIARDDSLTCYGGRAAGDALSARLREWVDRGMPGAASLSVRAYRSGRAPPPGAGEHLMARADTDYLWSESAPIP